MACVRCLRGTKTLLYYHVMRYYRSILLIFVILVVMPVACRLRSSPSETPTATPATPSASRDVRTDATAVPAADPTTSSTARVVSSTMTAGVPGPVRLGTTVDPAQVALDQPSSRPAAATVLRTLLTRSAGRLSPTGALHPDLAAWRWDEQTLVIRLMETAAWSDGAPITAADIVATAKHAQQAGGFARQVATVTSDGVRTVRITFDGTPSCAAATEVLLWPVAASPAGWPPARLSSPFTAQAADEQRWRLVSPHAERLPDVTIDYIPEAPALEKAWTNGSLDLIAGDRWLMGQPPPPSPPGGRIEDVPGPLLAALTFRLDHPVLTDATLRSALALGTDRGELYEAAYDGVTPLLTALLPPNHWAAPETGPATGDPDAAREVLAQAGWRDRDGDGVRENEAGEPLRFTLIMPLSTHDARWERLGPALQRQWSDLGIRLDVLYQEPLFLEERIHSAQWDVALLAYDVAADPDQTAMWSAPTDMVTEDLNVAGYSNAEVQALMQQAAHVAGCELSVRAPLYHRAWNVINQELPALVLFPLPTRLFLGERLASAEVPAWPPTDVCELLACDRR